MKYPNISALVPEGEHFDETGIINEGGYVSIGHLALIEKELSDNATALSDASANADKIADLQSQLDAANTAKKTAEDALATANQTITTNDAEITRLNKELNTAAADFQNTNREKDPQGVEKVNYALADNNPINEYADSVLPKNRKK